MVREDLLELFRRDFPLSRRLFAIWRWPLRILCQLLIAIHVDLGQTDLPGLLQIRGFGIGYDLGAELEHLAANL